MARSEQVRVELDTAQSEALRDTSAAASRETCTTVSSKSSLPLGSPRGQASICTQPPPPVDRRVAEALVHATELAAAGAEQLRESIFALNHAEFATVGLVPVLWKLVRAFPAASCPGSKLTWS